MSLEPSKDDETGMAWWNGLNERDRAYWAALAGTGIAKDAWEVFKRQSKWREQNADHGY